MTLQRIEPGENRAARNAEIIASLRAEQRHLSANFAFGAGRRALAERRRASPGSNIGWAQSIATEELVRPLVRACGLLAALLAIRKSSCGYGANHAEKHWGTHPFRKSRCRRRLGWLDTSSRHQNKQRKPG